MLLNHYKAMLEQHLQGKLASFIAEDGKTYTFASLGNQNNKALLPMLLHQAVYISVGSDNTPETGASYSLKKPIGSELNIALTRSLVDNDDGSHSSIAVVNCINTSSNPITVGEIALRENVQHNNSYSVMVCFDRTPLPTPLTIQPGEVGRIVYTITMA